MNMGIELANIDTIKDKVRERIQKEFVKLIPKEAWDELVAEEIRWFMTSKEVMYGKTGPAPLRALVRGELEKKFIEQLRKQLEDMPGDWSGTGETKAGFAVKEMVKGIAPELWEIAVGSVIQKAIETFRMQLGQSY